MIEKYIAMKLFFEYKLPLIIFVVILVVYLLLVVADLIISAFKERQKKRIDKYFEDDKGE